MTAHILGDEESATYGHADVAGGSLVAFTCRSPERDTANQDTAGWFCPDERRVVMAVADGAGGMPDGDQASRLAMQVLFDTLAASDDDLTEAAIRGIALGNQAVMDSLPGAATTMTVVITDGSAATTLQVGDSEAIGFGQRGKLRFYTMPHSPTGYAVEAGYLDPRVALYHPERHLLSNFIGYPEMSIEVSEPIRLRPLDTIVLASDGLTDNLFQAEIIELARKGPLDDALRMLVRLSQFRMLDPQSATPCKPDDLSIIAFRPRRARQRQRS